MQSNGNGTEVWEKGIQVDLPDGEYEIEVQLTGGSGRASVTSPAILQVQDEKAVIEIGFVPAGHLESHMLVWSSLVFPNWST